MFEYASSFNGDLSRWNTSQVTDMNAQFEDVSIVYVNVGKLFAGTGVQGAVEFSVFRVKA